MVILTTSFSIWKIVPICYSGNHGEVESVIFDKAIQVTLLCNPWYNDGTLLFQLWIHLGRHFYSLKKNVTVTILQLEHPLNGYSSFQGGDYYEKISLEYI